MKIEWHPEQITKEIETYYMEKLALCGELVAHRARLNLIRNLKYPPISRPPYKNGDAWTARVPGTLLKSIRVVRLYGDPNLSVRVYAGNRKSDELTAYYARWVEYGTSRMKAKPFLRPALSQSRAEIKSIMGAV